MSVTTTAALRTSLQFLVLSICFWQDGQAERAGAGEKTPSAPAGDKSAWKALFDGKTLAGWKETKFGGENDVAVEGGAIVMYQGTDMTGVTYAGADFPKADYEVSLEGKRIKGFDFFCTTTFPVGDAHCSLVMGGWGGTVVGLSSIDDMDASENDTNSLQTFKKDQWYRVRIRVTRDRIAAWLDDKQVVDFATKGHKISTRPECDLCKPFGIATCAPWGRCAIFACGC